jgi:hypothetical protein
MMSKSSSDHQNRRQYIGMDSHSILIPHNMISKWLNWYNANNLLSTMHMSFHLRNMDQCTKYKLMGLIRNSLSMVVCKVHIGHSVIQTYFNNKCILKHYIHRDCIAAYNLNKDSIPHSLFHSRECIIHIKKHSIYN